MVRERVKEKGRVAIAVRDGTPLMASLQIYRKLLRPGEALEVADVSQLASLIATGALVKLRPGEDPPQPGMPAPDESFLD